MKSRHSYRLPRISLRCFPHSPETNFRTVLQNWRRSFPSKHLLTICINLVTFDSSLYRSTCEARYDTDLAVSLRHCSFRILPNIRAGYFMRSQQLFSPSRHSPSFMKIQSSCTSPKQLAIALCKEPDESCPRPPNLNH